MNTTELLAAIDNEITTLRQVRALLAGHDGHAWFAVRPGRRVMSAEARERIAAAQRKRWAAQRKAAKKAS